MSTYRTAPPQLADAVFLTDGGIETTLIFDDGFDLPDFAAFVLLDRPDGRAALERYFAAYAAVAERERVGIVLETATWRASSDWGDRLGYSAQRLAAANHDAVQMLERIRARYESASTPVVISGCVGPRGDGYDAGVMAPEEARDYHRPQIDAFARSAADLVTAITMTNPSEAAGIALAARDARMPVVISFTVETDGALPTGDSLRSAIEVVDAATNSHPAYYMINCAHPTHFAAVLDSDEAWMRRIRGVRANASKLSHAELDEASELDTGDPEELAAAYAELRRRQPQITVLGGCCGTNHDHVAAIGHACAVRA